MAELWQTQILVVIPSVNGAALLARMLPTMRISQSQVVVLDQGSSDETEQVCRQNGTGLVQLGHPHTYTQACNIGARLARERGARYLCVSNNDITFRTDVLRELYDEMERDPGLAIAAPAQIVHGTVHARPPAAYRVFWNLAEVVFQHDTEARPDPMKRLEADFCELTCALIRMSVLDELGFLDDQYGFYHEDADFGFRLRKAGHACAYLPASQIDHFASATINRETSLRKLDYITRNRRYFADKHLGFAVSHDPAAEGLHGAWAQHNRDIHGAFQAYGLLDAHAPRLVATPGAPSDLAAYLYTDGDAARLSDRHVAHAKGFGAVLATTQALCTAYRARGVVNCFHLPLAVDPDRFHPWGPAFPAAEGPLYLARIHGQQRRLLRTLLAAWQAFRASHPQARLLIHGAGVDREAVPMGRAPDLAYRWDETEILHYDAEGIELHDPLDPPTPERLARLIRSARLCITGSQGAAAGLAALQSAACGVPCLTVSQQGLAERFLSGETGAAPLAALLAETAQHDHATRAAWVEAGLAGIRGGATLRHAAIALHLALAQLQIRKPSQVLERLDRQRALALPQEPDTPGMPEDTRPLLQPHTPPPRWSRAWIRLVATRRLNTIGRLTSQFAADWEARGLRNAGRTVLGELSYFTQRRSRQMRALGDAVSQHIAPKIEAPTQGGPLRPTPLLVGYIDAQLGLGQSLRGLAHAMEQTGIDFAITPLGLGVEGRRSAPVMPERIDEVHPHAINVLEVTADELPHILAHLGKARFAQGYNILRTYWELSRAPESWRSKIAGMDEIWAPNAFIADSLRPIFDGPITIVPPCVGPDLSQVPPRAQARADLDLADDVFVFLFSFDYFSFPQRKNPFGVIRAFREAFPDPGSRTALIIKTAGALGHFPQMKTDLRMIAGDDDRIVLIDETLSRTDMLALIQAADCYVSLHRAEGFGLGLAEAMAMGKPVIATDYSGNTGFLDQTTGYPIPYTLVPLAPDDYVHAEGQVWAQPDEAACARVMAEIVAHPDQARIRASAGQDFMRQRHGPANIGQLVKTRLREIAESHPKQGA